MTPEIKVTPLLGVKDVSRSSTLVKIGGKNILLDCGLDLNYLGFNDSNGHQTDGNDIDDDSLLPNFSTFFGSEAVHTSIDCVIISHYHLDHSGSLPYLTELIGYKGPIIMTQPTKTIAPFVWRDCQKNLQEKNFFPDFLTPSRINDCLSKVTTVVYAKATSFDNGITVTVNPSNQPLGPDIFHIEVGPQSIFYTGGCNLKPYALPPSPSHSKAKETLNSTGENASSSTPISTNQQGDLTIKMNGGMLSFKVGHSIIHRQLSPQEMQLVTAVFKNLEFMNESNEDEFWQRIAYEMTVFSSPLNDNSKLKWRSLFYDSLRSCAPVSEENIDSVSCQNLCDNGEDIGAMSNNIHSNKNGKKKRKGKKVDMKNKKDWSAPSGDLIKFDSPKAKETHGHGSSNTNSGNLSPTTKFNPDPTIINDQYLMISMFAERLKTDQIAPEFWPGLSRDLKRKGKIIKSPTCLEQYFNKLSSIQLEIMKTSRNAIEARQKWPHFDLLNDIDLSYFFQDKWEYRNLKKHFLIDSTTPNKPIKKKKQKQLQLQQETFDDYQPYQQQSTSPAIKTKAHAKHHHKHQQSPQKHYQYHQDEDGEEDEIEPQQHIRHYGTPSEDLADQLITITLFANRLKQTEISSAEFWKLLHKDFANIGKPIKPEVNLEDHYKKLAEIQLDVMANAKDMITAVSRWPLFMLLHELPLDIFLEDKWTYRKLKPKFSMRGHN